MQSARFAPQQACLAHLVIGVLLLIRVFHLIVYVLEWHVCECLHEIYQHTVANSISKSTQKKHTLTFKFIFERRLRCLRVSREAVVGERRAGDRGRSHSLRRAGWEFSGQKAISGKPHLHNKK